MSIRRVMVVQSTNGLQRVAVYRDSDNNCFPVRPLDSTGKPMPETAEESDLEAAIDTAKCIAETLSH